MYSKRPTHPFNQNQNQNQQNYQNNYRNGYDRDRYDREQRFHDRQERQDRYDRDHRQHYDKYNDRPVVKNSDNLLSLKTHATITIFQSLIRNTELTEENYKDKVKLAAKSANELFLQIRSLHNNQNQSYSAQNQNNSNS